MKWNILIVFIVILLIFIGICIFSPSQEGMTTSDSTTSEVDTSTDTSPDSNMAVPSEQTTFSFNFPNAPNGLSTSNNLTSTSSTDSSDSTYNMVMDALTSYFGSNSASSSSYTGPQGGQVNTYRGNYGQKATTYTSPNGNTYVNTSLSNNYDNYSHYTGTSYPLIYYGPNGGTARIIKTNNEDTIVVTSNDGHTDIYYIDNPEDSDSDDINVKRYYGPNGGSAKMITTDDGQIAVQVIGPDGNKVVYTDSSQDNPSNEYDNVDVNTYDGPAGGQVTTATGPAGGQAAYAQGPAGGQAAAVTGPDGNSAYAAQGPNGNTITGNTYDSNAYVNSLPNGITRSQIPDGDEDLYILKSEVVPPVCPKCPDPILKCAGGKDLNDIPPCPPCARCPEPAFDCKKVPNYKAGSSSYLPQPVLNDFSTFGM